MQQSSTSSSEELPGSGKKRTQRCCSRRFLKLQPKVPQAVFTVPLFAPPVVAGSWVWSVKEKAMSLLVQSEASTINTLLVIYLIL